MATLGWLLLAGAGIALIVWGAETFAEHLSVAAVRLGVSTFALALLLAGAEPEELATSVTAALRGAPGIALGNVVGTNIAICLVAIGVGACIAPLPFGRSVRRYAVAGLPLGALAALLAWDGHLGRPAGAILVGAYLVFVVAIWRIERRPPALGETGEIEVAAAAHVGAPPGRVGRELVLVLLGIATMAIGAVALVEGARRLAGGEAAQTRIGLTVVGFATAFELVVLVWSASRRGISEAAVAAVIGSFTYNVTMTLGAGALAHPLRIVDAAALHPAWLVMIACLAAVLIAGRSGAIRRPAGIALLGAYPLLVALAFTVR